ncbi:MAG: carboxypeptidase-like regulatory domain-containing protein [Bacteroidetes bacterium]|nr:carboxypeptidase-like regulatory domain-containing protein [Bacteroidota bacterium]
MNEKEKHTGSYDAAVIEKYLQGKLSSAEMHALEKAALDDPFLADAIEGITQNQNNQSLSNDVAELQQRLKQRISTNKNKIVPISYKSWLQIAAAVIVLAFSGVITFYIISNSRENKTIARENQLEKVDSTKAEPATPIVKPTDTSLSDAQASGKSETSRSAAARKKTSESKPLADSITFNQNTADAAVAKDEEISKKTAPAPSAAAAENEKEDDRAAKASSSEYLAPSAKRNSFMGKVTDEHNKPIAAASIELKDKKIAAVTDNNGNFKLNVKGGDSVVVAKINSIGYESALSDLTNDGSPNIIILRQDKSNLQEVVTTGMSNRRRLIATKQKTNQDATPVHGWDEYTKYLEKNKKIPQDSLGLKGAVVVSFSVNKKGKLSNFVIEQSLGPGYDEESIRLIKEGPAWKLLKGKTANVNVIVSF